MFRKCFRANNDEPSSSSQIADETLQPEAAIKKRKSITEVTCYPLFLLSLIALCINADQNLIAPNLTQIAREFNMTDEERDYKLGGQISLGFFLVGGIAAIIVGYLADRMNRRNLIVGVILMGEISTFCTLFVTSYWGLFITRAITGISIGGSNPLIMSILGDTYSDRNRGKAIALITIMFTLGVGLGQSVAGFIGPADAFGWRAPFAVMAIPIFILAPLFFLSTRDPPRGGKERAIEAIGGADEAAGGHVYEEKMDFTKLKYLLRNKTAVLGFFQGIPGSLPWGVLLVYFQDFLVQNIGPTLEGGFSVQESSVVILCFSIGASFGTGLGGVLSDRIWNRNPRGVPVLMGLAAICATLPLYGLINSPPDAIAVYSLVLFPTGIIAGIIGPAIRTVLMNVTLPETRGTAFAFHTLFDDIGKGLGPLWVSMLIRASGSRVQGFNAALAGWLICGLIMFVMALTVMSDVRKLEAATLAAIQRRGQNQNQNGIGIGIGEEAAGGMANFGTIELPKNIQLTRMDSEQTVKSDPGALPSATVFPLSPPQQTPPRPSSQGAISENVITQV